MLDVEPRGGEPALTQSKGTLYRGVIDPTNFDSSLNSELQQSKPAEEDLARTHSDRDGYGSGIIDVTSQGRVVIMLLMLTDLKIF